MSSHFAPPARFSPARCERALCICFTFVFREQDEEA
jgi:hypothetical protein